MAETVSRNARTLRIEEVERTLFIAVEANENHTSSYEGPALDSAIATAAARLPRPLTSSAARDFAMLLGTEIFEHHRSDIGFVLYAGVCITGTTIEVCTAGDIRVHLIENGRIKRVTRDHTAREDDASGQYAALGAPDEILRATITRALPASEQHPIECHHWNSAAGAILLICSSKLHGHREPGEYALGVSDTAARDGLFATISIGRGAA
jgi:hypothetical protein